MRLRIVSPERFCTVVAILVMIAFLLGCVCSGNSYEVKEVSIHEGDTVWSIADEYTGNDRDVRETVHIIRSVVGAMAVVGDAIDTATGKGIDPYSKLHSVGNNTNTIRQTVGDKYASKWFGGKETAVTGNLGKFTYDTLMSMGDNVANLLTAKAIAGGFGLSAAKTADLTSKITSGLMSSGAAADSIANAKLKGYTDEQALTIGISTGITEYLTEKIPLDNILKTPKSLVKGMLVGFVSEGLEEGASNWANKLTDYLIAGEDSDISMAIEGYISEGKSNKDAILKAIGDSLLDDTRAMLSGGFSGMGMSTAAHSGNRVKTNIAGRRIATGKYRDVTLSAVLSKGLSSQDAEIRKKAEIVADMEQGDTKKSQYHYRIGELAMDILSEDKFAFTSVTKMENARRLTAAVVGKVRLSRDAEAEILETFAMSDMASGDAILPRDNIAGRIKYRTDVIAKAYNDATGRELNYGKIFNANLRSFGDRNGFVLTADTLMDYAEAVAESLAPGSQVYKELSANTDNIAQYICDLGGRESYDGLSPAVAMVVRQYNNAISNLTTYGGELHKSIYGEVAIEETTTESAEETSNTELTNTAKQGTIKVTENAVDVSPVVNAISNTIKDGALQSISVYMQKETGTQDWDVFVRKIIDNYRTTGNIGEVSKYFADGGKAIIEAIENIGGSTYEFEGTTQGRALRDTSNVERTAGERTQERSEGISRETGDAQSTASETAVRKQIKDVTYNEVQREAYTDDMIALENENKSKYGVDTVYFTGHAIDGDGTEANGFYYKGILYLQIDDVHPLRSIRDHEITHHSAKTTAYDTFRKVVKAKMSVEQFKAWKEEVRLAYGDVLNAYLVKKFKDSGGTLSDEQLQTLMDDYLEEEMMANLNAESVDFASEFAQEIADFRKGIDSSTTTSNAEVSTKSKAENKPGEYSDETDAGEIRMHAIRTDNKGGKYWEIETGKDIFRDIKNKKELQKAAFNYILRGDKGEIINEIIDGQPLSFTRVSAEEYVYGSAGKSLTSDNYDKKMRMAPSITDLIENASVEYDTPDHKNHKFAKDGFKNYRGRVRIDDVIFEYVVRVGRNVDKNMFYDINLEVESILPSTKVRQKYKSDSTSKDRIPQNDTSVKNNYMQEAEKLSTVDEDIKHSITKANSFEQDSIGRELSKGQREYFKDSAVRDDDGNLKVMYRGDSNNFTVFDRKKSKYSNLYGRGFYFTDSKAHAEQYGDAREFYLNIRNPLSPEQSNITKEQMLKFLTVIENDGEDYDLYNYGQGATAETVLNSIWGKGDFEMLQDISASAVGDLVAAVELFNEVNGTNYDGILLPSETVTFDSQQAKLTSNESPTEDEDIRFSVSFDKSFEEQVDETLSSSTTDRNHVYVGNTTSILKQAGLDNLPMLITKGHLRDMHHEKVDGVTKYHGLSKEIINKIPNMLDYPAIMFDSLTDEKAVCILSDVTDDDGLPILIVIKPNGTGKYNNVEVHSNFVLSAYGKDNPQNLLNTLDNNTDNVLYMSKRKTQDLLKGARLSLPARLSKLRFDYIIHKSNAVVNTKEEPKMSVATETSTQDRIEKIAKEELFHEELTELARKNKKEFVSRVRENETLQKRLDNANRQMRLTKVPIADRGKVPKVLRDIMKEMHGTIKPGTDEYGAIYTEILSIYDEYISAVQNSGRVSGKLQEAADNMVRRFTDVAADIVDSAQEMSPAEDYKRLKDWIKSTAIVVPMDARKEADFGAFRKKHFGAFNLTNEGMPIDMAYQELCEMFPYVFDDKITAPADQLNAMADALEALKPEVYNPHAEYIDDAIEHVVSRFVLEADGIARTKDTRADRLVKRAEADKHTALEKQQKAFEKKYDKYKEKTDAEITKLKEQMQGHRYTQYWERRLSAEEKSQAIRNLRDRQKKSAVKAHIRKMVSELKQGLDKTEKSGGIPKELVRAIAEICSVIDFHTDRTGPDGEPTKASLKLDALQVQYDELKNNPDFDISSEWNEELSQFISRLNTTVRGKKVVDLSLMELTSLNDILVQIRHTIANAKKQIGIDNALENREIGIKICDDMNGREDFISSSKKMLTKRMATNTFAANTLNPMRVAEMISGYDRDAEFYKLFRQLNEGVHKGDMFQMDATKPFENLMEGPGNQALMYDFLTELYDTGLKDTKGNKVLLPKNMICEIIMLWERKQGRAHLEGGGMTLPNLKLFNSGKTSEAYTEGASRTRGITEADISRLRGMLNSYDKAWIEEARILFNEKSQRAINETSMQLVGRNIANAKNYIPIHTDRKFIRTDIEGLKLDATLEGAGSLKSVVENAKQPVLITGLSYSTSEHIDFVSKYHGLAIPIRNFNKVYNVSFNDETGTAQSVKETIGNKWGTKIQNGVIEQTLRDLQTNRNRASDTVSKVVATIQSNWIGATLSSNPSVSIKQLTSYVTAGAVLGSSPLIKALPYFANTKSTIAEIDRHTGIHYKRRLGYSTQELGDRANRKTGQGLANKARKVLSQSQLTSWVNSLPKGFFPTNWMQSVDCRVAAVLWEASKYYVSDTLKLNPGDDNYWTEVTQIYERTIEETQSNYDILHKPEVLKSTNEMTRLVSMFQNDALQGSGILWNSFNNWNTKHQNYKKEQTKENENALKDAQIRFKQAVFAQMSSALTLATLTLVARALIRKVKPYKDEEKEKVTAGSITKQVGYDTLGNLFTNAVPVLGNLLVSAKDTFIYGYDIASVPAFDTIQELIEAVSGFVDTHDKYFVDGSGYSSKEKTDAIISEVKNVLIAATPLLGIPLQNAMNMFNGIKGYVGDAVEGDFFHDIDDIIATNKRYYSYSDLASAISSGNTKQEMKIREYYKNIGVEIQKGSLTTQLKPAYVEYFVDEPHKARELKRKLILYYDFREDNFNDWIYTAYVNAVIYNAEYADEIEHSAKTQSLFWNYSEIHKTAATLYKKLYEENPEEAPEARKPLQKKLRLSSSFFDMWEREVKEKQRKKETEMEAEKAKYK